MLGLQMSPSSVLAAHSRFSVLDDCLENTSFLLENFV